MNPLKLMMRHVRPQCSTIFCASQRYLPLVKGIPGLTGVCQFKLKPYTCRIQPHLFCSFSTNFVHNLFKFIENTFFEVELSGKHLKLKSIYSTFRALLSIRKSTRAPSTNKIYKLQHALCYGLVKLIYSYQPYYNLSTNTKLHGFVKKKNSNIIFGFSLLIKNNCLNIL